MGSHIVFWGIKRMKRLVFLSVGAPALSLAGVQRKQPGSVNNAELNQPAADLNALANDAADAANAEDQALGNQQQHLNDENAARKRPIPSEAQEQNVDGM